MKKQKYLGYFLREITIVAIGVLIAVSIGNFKEKRDNDRYIEKTLQAIEGEVRQNQSDLDTILVRHYEMLEEIEEALEGDNSEETLGEFIAGLGGFQIVTLKNVSLRFFISNKAELVDFDLISQLLGIEAQTETLSGKIERLADFAYQHINDTDPQSKITFAFMISDVVDSEENLQESYGEFLRLNGKFLNGEEGD